MRWGTMMTALLLVLCLSPVWAMADNGEQGSTKTTTTKADKADTQQTDKPAAKDASATEAKADDEKTGDTPAKTTDQADKKAEAGQGAAQTVTCTVKEVVRTVEWRPTKEAEWQNVKVGDRLPLGAYISTGIRATCRLESSENSSVVDVLPITHIRIGEYEKVGEKIRTRLYLKQGTVRADVERARFQSDFAIVSPEVTLAVKGTKGFELKRHMDTGSHCKLMLTGLLKATNNKNGRSRKIRPGDKIGPGMNPAIKNVLKARLVAVYDMRGGNTPAEMLSIGNRPQTFIGTGNQSGPGGSNFIGGLSRSTSNNRQATSNFFQNNPTRLPNATPKPPIVVTITPPIIDDHGGSGM